jgi:hypothetical protein
MDEAKIEVLLEEATAHCYDREDELWAVFGALVGQLSYPLQARLGGQAVTLIGLDGPTSDLQAGVMARVQKGGQEEVVPLADVEVVDPDPASAEWLAVYRYWLARRG